MDVQEYYNYNTPIFMRFGFKGSHKPIHRSVFLRGDESPSEAVRVSHDLVFVEIQKLAWELDLSPHELFIADWGCGVGATLQDFGKRLDGAQLFGITNSPVQKRWAEKAMAQDGFSHRSHIVCGNFTEVDLPYRFHLIYALESFIHSDSATAFFEGAARHLHPGGRLVIVDDFLEREPRVGREQRWLQEFRRHWQARTLCTPSNCADLAKPFGLNLGGSMNLTPCLRLWRPRDQVNHW